MDVADLEARIDPRQALAGLGYAEVTEPVRVTGGWDTLLWHFATPDGREHSLRVHHLARRQEGASRQELVWRQEAPWRERMALEACAQAGLAAPRVEGVGEVEGLPAIVLSWCPGDPLLSVMEKRLWSLWRLGRLFGRAQAQMHAVAPPAEFVAKAPRDWAYRVEEQYTDLVEHALSLQLSTTSLIHTDFHPANLISDGATITGIIDWTGAAAGDPRADLARTAITLLAAPVPPGPMRPVLNLARRLLLRAWRSGYEEVASPMPDYRPLMAWAGATLLGEFELVVDSPGVWGTEQDIKRLRRLVDVWAHEAGAR